MTVLKDNFFVRNFIGKDMVGTTINKKILQNLTCFILEDFPQLVL